jgi:hypothetical protein
MVTEMCLSNSVPIAGAQHQRGIANWSNKPHNPQHLFKQTKKCNLAKISNEMHFNLEVKPYWNIDDRVQNSSPSFLASLPNVANSQGSKYLPASYIILQHRH